MRRFEIKTKLPLALIAAVALLPGTALSAPEGTRIELFRGGLDFPVDMVHVPGTKTIFFTEKNTGKIRILKGRELLEKPCYNLRVENTNEQGAQGIALDPDYQNNHYLYVYFRSKQPTNANRVVRFVVDDHQCIEKTLIFTDIPSSIIHNGGQLEFLDGYLFVSTGDAYDQGGVQDTSNLKGKILRINPDGSVPEDNPFSSPLDPNPVWSYGHRNPFGLTTRPGTSQLLETENGPNCDDEINLIGEGNNYGWGDGYPSDCEGPKVGVDPVDPLRRWGPTIAPTDPTWYRGPLEGLDDSLIMGDYNFGQIWQLQLNEDGTAVEEETVIHDQRKGIIDVARGPRGWLYFSTANSIKRFVAEP